MIGVFFAGFFDGPSYDDGDDDDSTVNGILLSCLLAVALASLLLLLRVLKYRLVVRAVEEGIVMLRAVRTKSVLNKSVNEMNLLRFIL